MKIKWNIKYTTMAVYSFIVAALSIIFYLIASEVNLFKLHIGKYISTLNPFIIGFVLAYLFNFILEFYEDKLINNVLRGTREKRKRIMGILFTYITVGLLLYLFLKFIFPQLISSIVGLVNDIPDYVREISKKIIDIGEQFQIDDDYYKIVMDKWGEFENYIIDFATSLLPKILNFTKAILSSIWNIVLGTIISIYLLIDKEKFMALGRKVVFSVFSDKGADRALVLIRRSDNIFGRFLSGKILDSLIIGVLTFGVLLIFKMPYATLIAFIVGVTNIIPFFGPFIGAVPSFFIILFESPTKAFWFLLIILVIQQIDGNIIGPKILGDSLGISAFWILFSLLVAGKVLGFIGLIIGVPLFVLIYSIVKDIVEGRLDKKGLPTETRDYYK